MIGETTEIGSHVKLYQGVSFIARSLSAGRALRGQKRHPTVEDHVAIYAGTTVMGGDTVVGAGSTIGANVFLTHSVPPHSLVSYRGKRDRRSCRSGRARLARSALDSCPEMIYLDYNATTPLCAAAWRAMQPYFEEHFGNPSSVHRAGRETRAALDEARDRLAALLGAKPHEIIFTSGGTEANNLALLGLARRAAPDGKHLISNRAEHHAVLHTLEHLEKREGFRSHLAGSFFARV